jgi:transcriptional regulator with XRE-family HTH domain
MRAARVRAGFTQEQVAYRLATRKSAISRLERGIVSRPNLTTIENYALVVGCRVEIRLVKWP